MAYFDECQKLKREVERDSDLCEKIRFFEKEELKLDSFENGNNNYLYRIGQLSSGLHVALRENRTYPKDKDFASVCGLLGIAVYETFCVGAEEYYCLGKRVPLSVAGYINDIDIPFLIVEDLTHGGLFQVIESDDGVSGYITNGDKSQEVWFDLGVDFANISSDTDKIIRGTFDINSLKYFHPENRLNL